MSYQQIISQFSNKRVLVIGEAMLDVYMFGNSNRLCREAPVPVVNVQVRDEVPGGAANTAVNVASLCAQVTFLSVTGQDREGQIITDKLRGHGVQADYVLFDPSRETIAKKRVLSDGQLLVRFDTGSTENLTPHFEKLLIDRLFNLYDKVDSVLISDYGYGVITDHVIAALKFLQRKSPKLLVVDSKHLFRYRSLRPAAVKPNYNEAIQLLDLSKESKEKRVEQIFEHGHRILELVGAQMAAITIDSDGGVIFERGKKPYRTYSQPVPDSQAAGAGDTYTATLTLALTSGLAPLEAAEVAAAAACVAVQKDGTAICTAEELVDCFTPPSKLINNRQELADRMRAYREQGRRVVFTNGVFDILHRGHITYLAQAKARGDILIVALNSDESVRGLKGPQRPINGLEDRMHVIAALDSVDHVVSFHESTPIELLKIVRPQVYVKGGDYSKENLPEAKTVEAYGGSVEILPYIAERSTTNMIEKIRAADQAG